MTVHGQNLLPDGWFRTGSLARRDGEDYCFTVDRTHPRQPGPGR